LPVPQANALPGPNPVFKATYDLYIELLRQCMDKTPSNRPSFPDIAEKLRKMATSEPVE
jgi:hypothetical protein